MVETSWKICCINELTSDFPNIYIYIYKYIIHIHDIYVYKIIYIIHIYNIYIYI